MRPVTTVADITAYQRSIARDGFALWEEPLSLERLEVLRRACEDGGAATIARRGSVYARRNLLTEMPVARELAAQEPLRTLVTSILGMSVWCVRALLFDKVPEANWHVGWHQDLMIPLAERHDVDSFSAWSIKAGVPHARPPQHVLNRMLTLRVHLDPCHEDAGPLRLIAGTHQRMEWTKFEIEQAIDRGEHVCLAAAGQVLAMRPLALHASSPATAACHRRVLHLEYGADILPAPLRWPREAVRLP